MTTARLIYAANAAALIDWLKDCPTGVDFGAFADECDRIAHETAKAAGIPRAPIGLIGKGVLMLDFAAAVGNGLIDPAIYNANVPGAAEYRRVAFGV